jgi:hypothetical protein
MIGIPDGAIEVSQLIGVSDDNLRNRLNELTQSLGI